ncbi:MAG: J domain-containing protein [Cyanobacteria bacterium J06623_5]
MKLAHHYRTLGLRRSASFSDVKTAYRQLVRQYHPDLNPDKQAIEQFIQINHAYTALSEALNLADTGANEISKEEAHSSHTDFPNGHQRAAERDGSHPTGRLNLRELILKLEKMGLGNFQPSGPAESTHAPPAETFSSTPHQAPTAHSEADSTEMPNATSATINSSISEQEVGLKQDAYLRLRELLQQRKFPRAIALVEGLAHRLPTDLEIIQWQAIVYQRWGRHLIGEKQLKKARLYLQKALQTDPHNPSLCDEVNHDLGLLDLLSQHISSSQPPL